MRVFKLLLPNTISFALRLAVEGYFLLVVI